MDPENLIESLTKRYGQPNLSAVYHGSTGELRLIIVKNDGQLDLLQGLAAALEDRDKVMLL